MKKIGDYGVIEYDKTTKDDYRLLVVFYSMGHRCGYVGLPEKHKANGFSDYSSCLDDYLIDSKKRTVQEKINDINVHGGLTYASSDVEKFKDKRYYFGFDCAHAGDIADIESFEKYFKGEKRPYLSTDGTPKKFKYVKKQVKKLYKQLREI